MLRKWRGMPNVYIDYDNLNVTSIEDGKIFDSDYSVDKEAATYTFDSTEKRIKIKLTLIVWN